ncbi:hypothetical protein EVAR_91659_1 [Eumeta japonica]|uniref:Nucleic-acid-binding protein from transposon X-element n=1 Tax=Eumeta variegata TaxID=151549 RepID=A0A4C1Z642_EUMVA|nr:hypothetical protein EVAR_91659_1 [Eumeta japonica]
MSARNKPETRPRKVSQTQLRGATKTGTGKKKLLQKATTTPPVLGTPPANIERAKSSQSKKTRTVASDDVSAVTAAPPAPPKVVVEVGPADAAAAAARESEAGVFTALEAVGDFARRASLKNEIGRPSLSVSEMKSPADLSEDSPRPELRKAASARPDALPTGRLASGIGNLAMEARRELEGLKNISRDVKESVIGKLSVIGELAFRLEESRSNYVAELEREKARRAREMEAAEKRITKITSENLDRILNVESKIEKMMVEVTSTRTILGHFDVPEKLEAIRKAVETRPARDHRTTPRRQRGRNPWLLPPKIPGPEVRSGAGHTLIISSRCENHTAEQVVARLRRWVDARGWRSSSRFAGLILKSRKGKKLPTVVIRDVLKINTDEDIVESLRTQNKHIADGLDWSRERAKVCYRRRARNDLECHPVLEVTTELYKRLIKAAYVYVGLQRRPVWDQSPLAQCSHCLGYGHSRRFCKEASEKCAHCGGDHVSAKCQSRSAGEPPRCINCPPAPGLTSPHRIGRGSSAEENTDHVSLRFIQSNLQRSKLATSELLVEADRRRIAVALVQEPYVGSIGELRRYQDAESSKGDSAKGPVKAAIIVLDSGVDVEEDQTLIDENVTAAVIVAGNCRIGVVSVYFEGHAHRPVPRSRAIRLL